MSGFIILDRGAFEHHLLRDAERFRAWFWMVARACWKPTPFDVNGQTITLQRGQFCASVRGMADEWGWSKSAVDRFLSRLETETMIERKAGHGKLVITICNYSKYQDVGEEERDTSGTASGTRAGHERDIKEQGNKGTIEEDTDVSSLSREQCEQVVAAFNAVAKPLKLSTCQKLSPARLKACKARIRDHGLEAILTAIQRIPDSAFLRGERGDWAGANIDFLLRPDSVTRILEGRYDDRPAAPTGNSSDGLVVALRRRLDAHDAEEPAPGAHGRPVRSGEGHSQGALALPSPDR